MVDKELILFKEWKEKRPGFVYDGIVNLDTYIKSENKILFVLKEVNGGENWDLRKLLRDADRKQTWDNIALWTFGINNIEKDFTWIELRSMVSKGFRQKQLQKIAAINLKKESGAHTANSKVIWKYSQEDKLLLRKQIKLYNPQIIVCCGTPTGDILKSYQLVEEFKNWRVSSWGIKFYISETNKVIINYCHPEARIDDNYKYFPLVNTIREIKKDLENE